MDEKLAAKLRILADDLAAYAFQLIGQMSVVIGGLVERGGEFSHNALVHEREPDPEVPVTACEHRREQAVQIRSTNPGFTR